MKLPRSIFLFFLLVPFLTWGTTLPPVEETATKNSLIEFQLKNGLRVCLKPTSYEEETVVFQLFAMGGYACLSFADRPSGMLAIDIARESGLGDQTADQVSFNLYQQSIELSAKIQPFDRQIEAYCYTEDLESCLNVIHLMFTHPKFDPDAVKKTIAKARETIRSKTHQEMNIREAFLKLHNANSDVFSSLSLADLDYVSLFKAERFYRQCFANPSEFVFVIVGDFNPKEVLPLIEKHLGTIPSSSITGPINPSSPPFPPGITKKTLEGFARLKEPLTRLTFPIHVKMHGNATQTLNCLCHLIKDRLQKELGPNSWTKKIDVSYEFPFYPKFDEAWLTIQFYTAATEHPHLFSNRIIQILSDLKQEGPTQTEVDHLFESLQAEDMEVEENTYLLSLITNYYRANWNLNDLNTSKKQLKLEKDMLKNQLNEYLQLDQYSITSLHR